MKQTSLKRLMCLFMIVSALMVIAVCAFMGFYYTQDMKAQNREYAVHMLEEFVKQTELRIEVISENLKRLSEKSSIIAFCEMSSVEKMAAAEFVRPLLDSYAETEPSLQGIYLCSREGILLQGHSYSAEVQNYRLLRACYRMIERQPLQESFRQTRYAKVYASEEADYRSDEYLLGVSVPIYGMEYSGALIALVDMSEILENLADDSMDVLVEYDGESIWSNRDDFYAEDGKEVISESVSVLPFKVSMKIDTKMKFGELTDYFKYNIPLVFGMLVVETVILGAIYLRVARQIENVAGQMKNIGVDSDPAIRGIAVSNKAVKEVVVVARGINGMLARVEELNRKLTAGEVNYLNSQIMFLKSQINPHFLFNSLASIRGMASMGSVENIKVLTESIASIYRYSMDENVMATIAEEVECIRLYARTFEARYDSKVEIDCVIEEGLERATIPRMILQPLAENAFLHAFAKKSFSEGLLKIDCRTKDGLTEISLENNMVSFENDLLSNLNSPKSDSGKHRGIGIHNVRRRIELLGGEGAGLVYRKTENGCLAAVITFPKKIL